MLVNTWDGDHCVPQAITGTTVTVIITTISTPLDDSTPTVSTVTETVTTTETVGASGGFDKVFDEVKIEQGVTNVLTGTPPTGYGLSSASNVTCPAHQPVIAGTSFKCSLAISGAQRSVTVTVKDDSGTYEVSPPN